MMNEEKNRQSIRDRAEAKISSKNIQTSQLIQTLSLDETQKIVHDLEVHQIELEMQNEELLRIQEELEKAKKRYFNLYDMAPVSYCTLNQDGRIQEVNLATSSLLGEERHKLTNQPFSHFILPEDQDIYYMYRRKLMSSDEKQECELRMIKADKTPVCVHLSAIWETNVDEEPLLCLVINDISKRKEMEKELKDKEEIMLAQSKQAAMGDMIAMIAHQWRQPLAIISMDINNLMMSINMQEEITTDYLLQHVNSVDKQIQQLSMTIDSFRNFFKPEQSKNKTSIEDILKETLNIVGKSLKNNNITLNIKNTAKIPLFIYKSSLIQVLLNIIGNAKDAFLDKKVPKATINIIVSENKETITISICDNAGGIPESIMNKIDQPYFTTKESLNGTGLGLYISRMIIEKHFFGTLTWHNEDEGACFVITFNLEHNAQESPSNMEGHKESPNKKMI